MQRGALIDQVPITEVTLICVTGTPRSEYQHLPRNLRSGGGGVIVISLVHIDDSFSVIFRYTLEMELH